MQLGRVIGTVVASTKSPGLTGVKLLIVQPLTRQLEPAGGAVVAADATAAAGPGELVTFVSSREAAVAMPDPFVPVDHAILGIVDAVELLAGVADDDRRRAAGSQGAVGARPARAARRPTGGRR